MTKREAKAVALYREVPKVVLDWHGNKETDEQLLKRPSCQMILKGMQWQTEQCVELCTEVFDQYETRAIPVDMEERILNAGTEEV